MARASSPLRQKLYSLMRKMMKCKLSARVLFLLLCSACSLSWLRFDLSSHLNSTAVRQIQKNLGDADNFTFAVLGDSRDNPEKFRAILAAAAGHAPAFIMHAGDLTNLGSAREFDETVAILRACPVPVVVIPGNHDLVTEKGRFFEAVFGPLDFYFQAGAFRFICINNADDVLDGSFIRLPAGDSPSELEGLVAGKTPACIVMHLPPATAAIKDHVSLPTTAPLKALLQKHGAGIRAILCGHVHGYAAAQLEGVPVIISGGAGAPLQDNKGTGFVSRFNFVLVSVRGRSISHTVHFVD
jgi:3',5'-cyclic AMP phosphodiesterase CpdA